MNMIVHQTIAQNLRSILGGVLREKTEVEASVCVRKEYRLTIIAPLRDVVGNAGNHNARSTWHTGKVRDAEEFSQEFKCV